MPTLGYGYSSHNWPQEISFYILMYSSKQVNNMNLKFGQESFEHDSSLAVVMATYHSP